MNPPSEKVSQTPQSSASSPTPPSEPAATPMEESPTLRSPKRPATSAKSASKPVAKSGLEIVSHSSAKAKAAKAASQDSSESAEPAIAHQATTSTTRAKAKALVATATGQPSDPKVAEAVTADATTPNTQVAEAQTADTKEKDRSHPISPPSEPMQYRAIGLIRGRYQGREDHVTKGVIHAADGSKVDAVLLGRVISLVKKHIDLDKEHLWVVYPRTREERDGLHVQIVGIWEPESLSKEGEAPPAGEQASPEATAPSEAAIAPAATATPEAIAIPETGTTAEATATPEITGIPAEAPTASEPAAAAGDTPDTPDTPSPAEPPPAIAETAPPSSETAAAVASPDLEDGFFSIRGEVVHHSQENNKLVIKIRQQPRKQSQAPKVFKLILKGTLDSPKLLRHFWEVEAQRQGNDLVVQKGTLIGIMPPVKRKDAPGDRNAQKKRHPNAHKKQFKRPRQSAGPEKGAEAGKSRSSGPKSKPMKKRPNSNRRSPKVPRNPL